MGNLKLHTGYYKFRGKIQLDHSALRQCRSARRTALPRRRRRRRGGRRALPEATLRLARAPPSLQLLADIAVSFHPLLSLSLSTFPSLRAYNILFLVDLGSRNIITNRLSETARGAVHLTENCLTGIYLVLYSTTNGISSV